MSGNIVKIEDFLTADYGAIFPNDNTPVNKLFTFFANPVVPVAAVVLYLLLSDAVFGFLRTTLGVQPKGTLMQFGTIIHSLALALYSLWTFVGSMQIVYPRIMEVGLYGTLCDPDFSLWVAGNFGFWMTHFYISKYYEFIDTWYVLLIFLYLFTVQIGLQVFFFLYKIGLLF
jgi:hypothetical protein